MDEQGPQVGIAALADVAQALLPARGVLPWHQAQPGRKLAARANCRITGGCRHGAGADRADTFHRQQALDAGIATYVSLNLSLQSSDAPPASAPSFNSRNSSRPSGPADAGSVATVSSKAIVAARPRRVAISPNSPSKPRTHCTTPCGPALDDCAPDAPTARPAARALHRDIAHAGRLAASQIASASCIVLVTLDVGFYELRCDQAYRVAQLPQLARPVCALPQAPSPPGTAAVGERNPAPGPLELATTYHMLVTINAVHLEYLFCQIQTNATKVRADSSGTCGCTISLALDAVGGRSPFHCPTRGGSKR